MTTKNPFMLIATTICAVFACVLIGFLIFAFKDKPRSSTFNIAFSLVNNKGEAVDETIFKGNPSMVYFGYTHCPEVCPTTLYEVTGYLNRLGEDGAQIRSYLFTVDPERDTPEIMNGYVTAFSDRITGVTGSPEEMKRVIAGWKAFAEKVPNKSGGYSMSHTMDLFLIGSDGRLKGLIPYGADTDAAVEKIRSALL